MIRVIVSHDVDHLYSKEHWFRDLIYPKMWIRTTLQLIRREISLKEWWLRNISCFRKERHHLEAMMAFDRKHGIQSTFFFGMNQGLGMSYRPEEAVAAIRMVHGNGFPVGVHGIDYQNYDGMQREFRTFEETAGFKPEGIRMHYVRFGSDTFQKLSNVGYEYDTTEFDKQNYGTRKAPYQIGGKMWEFPLTIMDGYLPQQFEKARQKTMEILEEAKAKGIQYVTVLFHDYQFCDDYRDIRDWYIWLIDYFSGSPDYCFVSYREAVRQLESQIGKDNHH